MSKPPCSICYPFTKDDIDNPDFNEEDWKEFWRMSKEYYPLHSVYGGRLGKDVETIISSEKSKLREQLRMIYKKPRMKGKRVLEIGYGFGGAGLDMIKMGADYTGIDYVTSNKDLPKDRFLEINVSGIPEGIMSGKKFDLVYSENVFQHLTQKQRFDYIKQAHEILKDDGVFFFSVFERIPGQGLRDDYSTTFFNVHTKVDEPGELQDFLSETGFTFDHSVRAICYETYCAYYVCRKKPA
jgi:2-polyprenyl-3-methyl-5-hydroxy-6-metoxy-1,4-benzoquinol methylase